MQSVTQLSFPLIQKILLKTSLRTFSLNYFITVPNAIPFSWKVRENYTNRLCFVLTFWSPAKVKVNENVIKWKKSIVPVSIAGMKGFGWKVCVQCPTLNFELWTMDRQTTAGQPPSQTDEHSWLHRYIHYSSGPKTDTKKTLIRLLSPK